VAGELPVALRNSTIVAVAIVVINLVLGTNTAYAFSRTKFRGSYKLFLVTICTRLLPEVGIIIPFYIIIRSVGLLDTLFALILIHSALTLPFSIWILTSYLSNVPTDIEDSARVDGYSRMETLYKVVLPIITPGLVAIGIFSFMLSYRDFIFAFVLTQTMASHTVPVVIAAMTANPVMPIGLMCAAGIIAMIPPVIVIVLFRRYIIRGLVSGATVR
jgi:multiple sugar transport system permease protein